VTGSVERAEVAVDAPVTDEPVTGGSDRGPSARDARARVALVLVSASVAVAVLVATASGLGVSPDGVSYLSLAEQFRAEGSPYPLLAPSPTHYAPLWSVVVGGIAAVVGATDLLAVGRWLNVLSAAAIPLLVAAAVRRSPAAPAWWAVLVAAMVAASFGLFRLSARALTEPMFIVLLLGVLLLVESAIRRRSRTLLYLAAVVAAALVATRFAGVVVLAPLAVAAWRCTSNVRRRAVDSMSVAAITIAPTALWVLAAPESSSSTHLDADARAGLSELVDSVIEAGHALVVPPSTGFANPIYLVLGVVVLVAPFVAGWLAVRNRQRADADPSGFGAALVRSDLLVWLLFLVAYTALISAQRWWIDREIIDRYWVPFVVVAVVIVARSVAEVGLLRPGRGRLVVVGATAGLLVVGAVQIGSFSVTRFDRGIELNESQFSDSAAVDALAAAEVDIVITDSTRLVELHLEVLRGVEMRIVDVECEWSGASRAVELASTVDRPAAVLLADVCNRPTTVAELSAIPGSEVVAGGDEVSIVLFPGR